MIYIELKNVIVQNKSHGFNTKLTSGVLNKKPLELNLDKLMAATNSHISVTLIDNK